MKPHKDLACGNPRLQCCDRKCRPSSTDFSSRQTQNPEGTMYSGDEESHLRGVILHGLTLWFEEIPHCKKPCRARYYRYGKKTSNHKRLLGNLGKMHSGSPVLSKYYLKRMEHCTPRRTRFIWKMRIPGSEQCRRGSLGMPPDIIGQSSYKYVPVDSAQPLANIPLSVHDNQVVCWFLPPL